MVQDARTDGDMPGPRERSAAAVALPLWGDHAFLTDAATWAIVAGMQSVPFNPGAMRGPARAVGSLAGLTPARSWRDDLLSLLAERRSLVEVRDWATARGVHYRDEVLPLLEEWVEQGLLKTTGEAKEKRIWATKPGEPLPDVTIDVGCAPPVAETPAPHRLRIMTGEPIALDDLPPGMRAAIEQLSPGTTEVQRVPDGAPIGVMIPPVPTPSPVVLAGLPTPYRQDPPAEPTADVVDAAILGVLAKAGRPVKATDMREILSGFSWPYVKRCATRLRQRGRIVGLGTTSDSRWALPKKPKATAPAPKPEAPPVEKTSLPQAEERKPCSGKCHRDTKPVNSSGELVAIVLIGPREDVLPRLRAALEMIAKRDGE